MREGSESFIGEVRECKSGIKVGAESIGERSLGTTVKQKD